MSLSKLLSSGRCPASLLACGGRIGAELAMIRIACGTELDDLTRIHGRASRLQLHSSSRNTEQVGCPVPDRQRPSISTELLSETAKSETYVNLNPNHIIETPMLRDLKSKQSRIVVRRVSLVRCLLMIPSLSTIPAPWRQDWRLQPSCYSAGELPLDRKQK